MTSSRVMRLAPWQYLAANNPFHHFAFFGGVATGKTFTGAQFVINMMRMHPNTTGFIGANTYDQLSQATLKALFEWLSVYRIPFVINQVPPASWGAKQKFATYNNILSCRIGTKVVHAFVRVLSDPDALRGIEFSWYWLDESRDTPENTHDVVLSRMRESKLKKGLITTTTNGEDWCYRRFAMARPGQKLYGSMHVPTIESLNHGIIDKLYYDTMLASYTELMAQQELWAMHVNVSGGRAYYAAGEWNRKRRSLWGDLNPDPQRDLIIGADFNFSPAPHVWMVGQMGENPKTGKDAIHWFGEISGRECSTVDMTLKLINQYPDFFYRVYGDRSGARATTSNAGKHDYDQIAQVLRENEGEFSIDSDTGNNPLVRNRVENMNRLFRNALGEVHQTYDPSRCPYFDSDVKMVGWKANQMRGQGKLDSGGNVNLTHASDGGGYAVWKLLPYTKRGSFIESIPSLASTLMR